jgi:hypothetical protein
MLDKIANWIFNRPERECVLICFGMLATIMFGITTAISCGISAYIGCFSYYKLVDIAQTWGSFWSIIYAAMVVCTLTPKKIMDILAAIFILFVIGLLCYAAGQCG